jgi:hypothetical protein
VSEFSSSEHLDPAGDFTGIVRLVRRICLYREQGDAGRAERLQADELVSAVAAYRLWHGPDSLTDEKLWAIFVSEAEHVREAIAFASMVVPDLVRIVPATDAEPEPVFRPLPKPGSLKPFPDNPPAITELLDAMLAAQPRDERPTHSKGGRGNTSS